MAEFDEKLNSILSNPNAMAQIMQLAQSITGENSAAAPPPPQAQPFASPQAQPFASPSQAQPFSPPPQAQPMAPPPPPPQSAAPAANPLSALGNMDPKLMMKLLPLIQELGGAQDSDARRLLYALSPYLKPDRRDKIERALQLARLFHIGRQFLAKWEE